MQQSPANQRIKLLDIVRGLAILGILLINMSFFTTSLQAIQFQLELWPDWWDRAVQSFLDFFVSGKFFAMFAFLFGYGMILMKDAALQRERRFAPLYSRRLFALLFFGLMHGWFIWYGDILFHYALLGFALLLFHNRKAKTLLIWSCMLLLLMPGLMMLSGTDGSYEPSSELMEQVHQWVAEDETIYGSGSWSDIQEQRMNDWSASVMNQILFYPQILGLFLLGAYFAKKKWFQNLSDNHSKLWWIGLWTGGFGFLLQFTVSLLKLTGGHASGMIEQLEVIQHLVGSPLIGVFYIVLMALLIQKRTWEQVLSPLGNVGRMAFTNYIMQSVICTLLFYSYGLGWFGEVGPTVASLLAVVIFVLQIVWSTLWLRYFRMGPLEWLWRGITYLSVPPLVVKPSSASPNTDNDK